MRTISPLSIEEKVQMWTQDPHYEEYKKIDQDAKTETNTIGLGGEGWKKFVAWDPIRENPLRDVSELRKHIHPATIVDDALHRIHETTIDTFRTAFTWEPKIGEKIVKPTLIGRYITFHRNGHPLCFKPSIAEVLQQLPQELTESKDELYFDTDLIHPNANVCSIGSPNAFHIAVTSVYRE